QAVAYEAFCGVGFGFPNPMQYPEGICLIKGQHKYDALYGVHIGQAIRARLPLGDFPLLFRNDAEAAIVGEAVYGAGRACRRLIGVTLGTGLGSAFVVDGVRQASGPGVPEEHDGFLWPLLVVGDQRADDVFSIRGLEGYLQRAGAQADSIREAAVFARQGDAPARAAFEQFGADLGAFLRPFVEAFQAEAVLSMGGISGALDVFGPALRAALPVPVLASQLGEEAALIGAADLVLPR
ncbi:MAG: ROK family protein, partial [Anaerolineae bacterium]|nr:ROK family protein [Anaerolineae bacterium]